MIAAARIPAILLLVAAPWLMTSVFNCSALADTARIFYVDFESGQDNASGTSPDDAWKHAPGDPSAGGAPADIQLAAGDIVQFRGGIRYYGSINIPASGGEGSPIVYRGTGWGNGRAIIDGSLPRSVNWRKCRDETDCFGNPHWPQLYLGQAKNEIDPFAPLFLGPEPLWLAQEPNQPKPLRYDDIEHYYKVEHTDPELRLTQEFVSAPWLKPAASWNSAYLAWWVKNNAIEIVPVEGFDAATHTIHFRRLKNKHYTDRPTRFSILNRPVDVDRPGEYAVLPSKQLLLWPPIDSAAPGEVSIATQGSAIQSKSKSNVTIEGFEITRFYGSKEARWSGAGIVANGNPAKNLRIKNNLIYRIKSMAGTGLIEVHNVTGAEIVGNRLDNSPFSSGIRFGKSRDVRIAENSISRIGRTGIRLIRVHDAVIGQNILHDINSIHGNGISVYLENTGIFVLDNVVYNTHRPFTFHGPRKPGQGEARVYAINNVFVGDSGTAVAASWGTMTRLVFMNNIALNTGKGAGLFSSKSDKQITVVNNILSGWAGVKDMKPTWQSGYNTYLDLGWDQKVKYDWRLADGELIDLRFNLEPLVKLLSPPSAGKPPSLEIRQGASIGPHLKGISLPANTGLENLPAIVGPIWGRLPKRGPS
ncbi:MAG: right-handed parallel beta-helix repeat-containing protein [Alphaproteobacteria bacterium]|nr:right-handed parallel beta-helix repeat-containing protein [Alphaproteobacteria bacterium]